MKKAAFHIAFAFIILLGLLPALQMKFRFVEEKPLNGAFKLAEKPDLTLKSWHSGEFQQNTENYLKDHSGFRNFLVRLQNQVDYWFFRQANAEGAVVGKKGQLFEYDYIRSWLAADDPGDSFIDKKLRRTKYVQEYLKREKNIDLVVVFEPGKASFYPEFIPEKYSKSKKGPSTYEHYLQKAHELDIDYIDLNQYFLDLKPDAAYPLYPRYGTHWSVYGMRYAADSLLNFIEKRRSIILTAMHDDSLGLSSEPFDTDDDVLKTMNLLIQPQGELLAYPFFRFDTLHPGEKPHVLVIADSYYWNIFNTRIPKYLFANEAFWYFNTLVYPDHYLQPTYTKDLNLQQEAEKQNVIFLMVTERFVHKFDWRFIDQLFGLYAPAWLNDPVYDKINDIMQVAPWYNQMISKAEKRNIPLEDILNSEGKFMVLQEDTLDYMLNYGVEHFSNIISGDPGWMAHVEKKARERGIPVEEMLEDDALYIFNKDFPGLFELNRALNETILRIYSDKLLLDSLEKEAARYYQEPSSFIKLKAWQIYRDQEIEKSCEAIRKDEGWYRDVSQKAKNKGITVEEMIRLDAEYMWEKRVLSSKF